MPIVSFNKFQQVIKQSFYFAFYDFAFFVLGSSCPSIASLIRWNLKYDFW